MSSNVKETILLEESSKVVFEEVSWRGGSINGSTSMGGSGTVLPLVGTKAVPGTTCRAWALPVISTTSSCSMHC
ncbi:UNVERIFIED_CONTAM: hypothetical protein Sradi_2945300 [Sesamum radiatum]|uniref:Uncharacterized protein n=1 Tax=Sesamum radiatum TaxID=300843 RepID=A0AAW2RZ47_SESRA